MDGRKRLSLEQAWAEAETYIAIEAQIMGDLQQKLDIAKRQLSESGLGNSEDTIYKIYHDQFNNFNIKLPFATNSKAWVDYYKSGIGKQKINQASIRRTLDLFSRCNELVSELGLDYKKRENMEKSYEHKNIHAYEELMKSCLPIYIHLIMEGHSLKELRE